MITTNHVRDLVYAGPSKVTRELGDRRQHFLCCYCGVGGVDMYNKRENSEQEVAAAYSSGQI